MGMDIGLLIWSVFRSVLMFVIIGAIGFILKILKVFTPATDSTLSKVNYTLLLPIYAVIEIGFALQIDNVADPLTVLLTLVIFYIISFCYGLGMTKLQRIDNRFKYCYILVLMFGNFFIMPGMVVEASCKIGGIINVSTRYTTTNQKSICSAQNNGWSYASIGLIAFGFLWFIATPFIESDKKLHFKTKRRVRSILHFYPTVAKFMDDLNLESAIIPKNNMIKADPLKDVDSQQVQLNLEPKEENVEVSDALVEDQIHSFRLTDAYQKKLFTHYKKLKRTAKGSMPTAFVIKKQDFNKSKVSCCFILGLVRCPPVIAAIGGIIIGLMKPQHDWFYNPSGSFIIFIDNFRKLGNMAAPVGLLLMGSKLPGNFKINKKMYIRYTDLVLALFEKYVFFPLIGYGLLILLIAINPNLATNMPLNLTCYMQFVSPFAVNILLCYLVYAYGVDEVSLFLFWHHVVCSIPMCIWIVLWGIFYVA